MNFWDVSLPALVADVRGGRLSAHEIMTSCLARIEAVNPMINAFTAVDPVRALTDAQALDERIARGEDPGPLAGVPLAVKDNEDARGFTTTHGSWLFAPSPDSAPADRDSVVVARLRAAGCVVVGKTNLPELATASYTHNERFGVTRNPWHRDYGPGGSSGGSAAAIAAGLVPLATGSDGGGSIRIPSSCCGFSGLKPSLGRIPDGDRHPPAWLDLSTKGPLARRLSDVMTALSVTIGPDPSDPRSLPSDPLDWSRAVRTIDRPLRVGWSATLGYAEVDDEVRAVCEASLSAAEQWGAQVVDVDSIFATDPIGDWLRIAGSCTRRTMSETPAGRARLAGADDDDHPMDPHLLSLVRAAARTTGDELLAAIDRTYDMSRTLADVFDGIDILLTPTIASTAPPLELNGAGLVNGERAINWARFTYPFNMTRSPAATVCVGLSRAGLPIGLQIVGPQHADLLVLRTSLAFEAAMDFTAAPQLA